MIKVTVEEKRVDKKPEIEVGSLWTSTANEIYILVYIPTKGFATVRLTNTSFGNGAFESVYSYGSTGYAAVDDLQPFFGSVTITQTKE